MPSCVECDRPLWGGVADPASTPKAFGAGTQRRSGGVNAPALQNRICVNLRSPRRSPFPPRDESVRLADKGEGGQSVDDSARIVSFRSLLPPVRLKIITF
jgi:hypothetical protein